MALKNPGGLPGIGKRWPYKALNFLPDRQLWKYLDWKSPARPPDAPFDLGKSLTECKRILIAMPDGFQDNLVAFPVVQSLVQERPDSQFHFLIDHRLTGFLAAVLGSDRVTGIRWEDVYWGEPHFQELQRATAAFRPDLSLNFRSGTPPLLQFILRASGAALRVQASGESPEGYANIALRPAEPPNHLRRALQIARLWEASSRPVPVKWTRLAAGPDNLKEAAARLAGKGLKPEATRLFLWQDDPAGRQPELFRKAISARAAQGEAESLVIVNGAGPFFPTPPPPSDLVLSVPTLEVDSTGLLLGLFARTRRSIGLNGPLLHLASLADTDVEAHFTDEDAPWDTSALNPRMRVLYVPGAPGATGAAKAGATGSAPASSPSAPA